MKFATAQKRINKLGAVNNQLTIGSKRLTITEKHELVDDIIVEDLNSTNPFNKGNKPYLFVHYRTLEIALNNM